MFLVALVLTLLAGGWLSGQWISSDTTLARWHPIEMAPPVVAGIAWFRINGGHVDPIALGLSGYALLMAMVQIRLIPLYRTVPFGPGWWAFSFPYAATVAYALQWSSAERVTAADTWTWALLALVTAGAAVLAGRTIAALVGNRFLPPLAPPVADPGTELHP